MPPYKGCVVLGQRLRARRRELRLRTRDVAEQLGVKQPTVSRWENGRCPERESWPSLASFLGISVEEVAALVASGDVDPFEKIRELEEQVEELERRLREEAQPPDNGGGARSNGPRAPRGRP